VRGETRGDREGVEGQGEVIQVTAAPAELAELDASPDLLQSGFWGYFKASHGWKPHAFRVQAEGAGGGVTGAPGSAEFPVLVLTRSLPGSFVLAYVPFGPSFDPGTGRAELLLALAQALRPSLPDGTLLVRFDLPWPKSGEAPAGRGMLRVVKSRHDMQPASTVVVDITPSPEQILASMKSKTRYNIRLAAKKGVVVEEGGSADLDRWYTLYRETSARDRIAIHSREYYRGLLDAARVYAGVKPFVGLLLARHDGDLLAGNIVAFWRERAAYLYGASSGEKRNLMPTYALQWDAICRARDAGCRSYDLFGVPSLPDPGQPMYGLYQFKTGFHDDVLRRWGTWDVPLRPLAYAAYGAVENARMIYYRTLKKRLRGRPQGNDA
jgi:lipid II:glycine glycyltransferase (peptidoglycan interpeptide bridge formation enzyme)